MPELTSRLTLPGWLLLTGALLSLFFGLVLINPVLTQAALFGLLLLAAAVPIARLNLRRLDGRVCTPEAVFCNEDVDVEFWLQNSGRVLPAFDVDVDCSILRDANPIRFACVLPSEDASGRAVTRFVQRGVHTECRYTLHSHFPWGLIFCERSATTLLPLIVCPSPRVSHDLKSILEQGAGHSGCWQSHSNDPQDRLSSVREFRPGDRIKLVSWPFSARQGKLIIKEMEQPGLNLCSIVFHSYQPPRTVLTRQSFETALSTLAGLFVFFHDHRIPFRFLDCSVQRHDITVHPDDPSIHHALACLAAAEMKTHASMDTISLVLDSVASHAGTLLVVSNAPLRLWENRLPHSHSPWLCMDNHQIRMSKGFSP